MSEQRFTHENEIIAMAPLNADEDSNLFAKQSVHLTAAGDVQWDFILHDGRDWHFRQETSHLLSDARLSEFKQFIRDTLMGVIEGRIS
jgi:hypothetical protein